MPGGVAGGTVDNGCPLCRSNTTTQDGLKIRAELDRGIYPTGLKITDAELSELNLKLAKFHGDWNYTLLPQRKKN